MFHSGDDPESGADGPAATVSMTGSALPAERRHGARAIVAREDEDSMRVNRTLLYAGIFLVAVGGVVVAADLAAVGDSVLVGTLKFWPLAVIALGLGLVFRRTQLSLGSGLLAAAVPGLILGSALAAVPRVSGFCTGDSAARSTQQGTFDGPASVSVTTDCGSLDVSMAPGNEWRLDAPDVASRSAAVSATARTLSISSATRERGLGDTREDWNLVLPASGVDDLSVTLNAGHGSVHLDGGAIRRMSVSGNAADIVVDASSGQLLSLSGEVNVGQLSLHLGAGSDFTGSVDITLGEFRVCAPPDLGLRITAAGETRDFEVEGTKRSGSSWQSPGYASAPHHVNLDVNVDFGAIQVNPIGGCK